MFSRRIEKPLIKTAAWIGAAIVLLQLAFSECKRREWQKTIEILDAANNYVEQNLADIAVLRSRQPG